LLQFESSADFVERNEATEKKVMENTSQSASTLNWVSKMFLSMTDRMNGQIIDG